MMNLFKQIMKTLKAGQKAKPRKDYLIFYLFAGHGILRDGMQTLVLNEFDPQDKFYKTLQAEN